MSRPAVSKRNKTNDKEKSLASASKGMRLAAELIAGPLTGSYLGYLLEKLFPTIRPFGLIGGFILGTVAAFYTLIKTASAWDEEQKKARQQREQADLADSSLSTKKKNRANDDGFDDNSAP